MKKIYIVDETVLLSSPKQILSLQDQEVILTEATLIEVSKAKKRTDNIGYNARLAFRLINEVLEDAKKNRKPPFISIIDYDSVPKYIKSKDLESSLENKMLLFGRNIALKEEWDESGKQVILLTKNVLQRVKGDAIGLVFSDR